MDIFSPKKRSEIMSRVRGSGTGPEGRLYLLVRDALDPRFRVFRNCKRILGVPDIYVPALSLVFFADGCFFHGCPIHGSIPKSNIEFWRLKIERNMQRDRRCTRALRRDGFSVWRLWEHDLKNARIHIAESRVKRAIQSQVRITT